MKNVISVSDKEFKNAIDTIAQNMTLATISAIMAERGCLGRISQADLNIITKYVNRYTKDTIKDVMKALNIELVTMED